VQYDSIGTLASTLATCWCEGVFSCDDAGVEEDRARFLDVSRQHNPAASAGHGDATSALVRDVSSDDPLTREPAARKSGEGADAIPLEALLPALSDSYSGVRAEAALALARLKDPRSGEPLTLTAALTDPATAVRASAAWAIAELRYKPGLDGLMAARQDPQLRVRVVAARALPQFKAAASIPALLQATEDPDAELRILAIGALAGSAIPTPGKRSSASSTTTTPSCAPGSSGP